jgi:hypothetical protein
MRRQRWYANRLTTVIDRAKVQYKRRSDLVWPATSESRASEDRLHETEEAAVAALRMECEAELHQAEQDRHTVHNPPKSAWDSECVTRIDFYGVCLLALDNVT